MYNIIKTGATLRSDSFLSFDQWLSEHQIDAVVCILPENCLYFTGVLPVLGVSAVFYMPGNKPILLQPKSELEYSDSTDGEVVSFPIGHLEDADFLTQVRRWCDTLAAQHGQMIHAIGLELTHPVAAPPFSSAEMSAPDQNWIEMMQQVFAGCLVKDATPGLVLARSIKSEKVLTKIKRTNTIAKFGLDALQTAIQPGMREVQASALVESEIKVRWTGFEGARLVKAYAQITSGVEGTIRQSVLTPSGQRKFRAGDLVMIELAVCADGYWSDLTRVYCVGSANDRQREVFNAVRKAQAAAAACLIPGNTWESADKASRDSLNTAGLGDYFIHGTGHGVGYKYHETIPQLGPGNQQVFQVGMVTSVEPGVYIPGFGGIRIEDNLAVTPSGPLWLSEPCEGW